MNSAMVASRPLRSGHCTRSTAVFFIRNPPFSGSILREDVRRKGAEIARRSWSYVVMRSLAYDFSARGFFPDGGHVTGCKDSPTMRAKLSNSQPQKTG